MRTPEEHDEDVKVINAMRKYGGSFIKSLAETCIYADETNFERIKKAFPDYWEDYKKMIKYAK